MQPRGVRAWLWVRAARRMVVVSSSLWEGFLKAGYALMDRGYVPDFVVRFFSRLLLRETLAERDQGGVEDREEKLNSMVKQLKSMPIAIKTGDANEQHYEVPTEFFLRVLGPHLKYSCCLYKQEGDSLADAEEYMLELYCERADLEDLREGASILDLGCGWGSLSLYLAKKYPKVSITSLSNSTTQRNYIVGRAKEEGLGNLQVHTGDISEFDSFGSESFDRILSIEMFEHMKNYELLLEKLSRWLKPQGKLFVHIFSHVVHTYHYEVQGEGDWMTKYFFEGGTMPAHGLLLHFQKHLRVERTWHLNGKHYARTSRHWLELMDENKAEILSDFASEKAYGPRGAYAWWMRWRVFFIAVEEMFAFDGGEQWGVSMYKFVKD